MLLHELGCSEIQGFFLGRPMSAEPVAAMLADERGPRSGSGAPRRVMWPVQTGLAEGSLGLGRQRYRET